VGKTPWVRKMSEGIGEFEKELTEIVQKLTELKAITKDKTIRDLVYALNDILNESWDGYIKLRIYEHNSVIELYERDTYIAQFEIPNNESIISFKQYLKQNKMAITLKLLGRIAYNLKFLEENKIQEKFEELEEKIAELEDP
jgi:hypothetical protein